MSIYDTHKPAAGEGSGLYLKIQEGQPVRLRIASEPAIFETEGERDGKVTLSTRYGWKVYNQDTKQAQILQQSATFFKNLAALAQDEEWGDPTGYDIKISRQGSSFNDTTYTITPSANREPLDSEAKEAIKAIDLIEKLNASPFSQRVSWLSEFDQQPEAPKGTSVTTVTNPPVATTTSEGIATAAPTGSILGKATPSKPVQEDDVVITDIGNEPVNLDDIPF